MVSAYLQRADLFGLYDAEHDRSSKENLAWLLITGRDESDFAAFRGLVPFETAALLLPRAYLDSGEPMASAMAAAAARLGFRAVGVGDDTSAVPAELEGIEAVVLSPLPQLSEAARKGLIGTLTDRGIPTFSLVGGDPDVELGALATTADDVSRQLTRRVALNLGELIRGRPVGHLPVALAVDTQLRINARTAVAVGYDPDAPARILAHFVHPEALESEEDPLTLAQTLELALAGNVTLSISGQDVETAYQRQRVAQSGMLPQAYAPATYYQFNPRGLEGLIPDKTFSLGVYLRQMIYDDRVVTDYKSAGKDYEASREALETQRMNVLAIAGASFLDLTLSRILYGIEVRDLAMTEENLQLARVRLETGYSGPDEVFRWESEVARRRSALLDREAQVDTRRIALNQVLGIDQGGSGRRRTSPSTRRRSPSSTDGWRRPSRAARPSTACASSRSSSPSRTRRRCGSSAGRWSLAACSSPSESGAGGCPASGPISPTTTISSGPPSCPSWTGASTGSSSRGSTRSSRAAPGPGRSRGSTPR